jgi:hypothetical protein
MYLELNNKRYNQEFLVVLNLNYTIISFDKSSFLRNF